ncbi:MAG: hypothetical protein JWP75_2503 [Frondihabitans sp.]|nr:hypothetical protein [Frondihabitans sp.]
MSKSSYETKRDEARQAMDEQEVREALLGDGTERNSAWLFEQLDGGTDVLRRAEG